LISSRTYSYEAKDLKQREADMKKYFKTAIIKDITVITFLSSETAMEEIEALKTLLYRLASDPNKNFVINMCMCSFIPSLMLGVLASFNAKVGVLGGRVAFACLTEHSKTVFRLTKLDKIFNVYSTEKEAVESFK